MCVYWLVSVLLSDSPADARPGAVLWKAMGEMTAPLARAVGPQCGAA